MRRIAVVVDPLGTGQEYPAAFGDEGVDMVAVLSQDVIWSWADSWHPEYFTQVHKFEGDVDTLADTLRGYDPICILPGAETGVELADALVERLLPPGSGNVPELSAARRDKGLMAQAALAAGIPAPRQTSSADAEEIAAWISDSGLQDSRLVFKPPRSAGTDDVHIVPAGQDWRPFFDQIYGQTNALAQRNDSVIVQEYLEGTEYMVNSYSAGGRHGLTDVCRYQKGQRADRIGIYKLVEFLEPDHPDVQLLWPYAQRVLDALGIRNGCAHTEVIVTADGPRFIEVGARQAGGGHMMITKLATGTNQVLRHAAHQVRGEFTDMYELKQHVCSVVISAEDAGIWKNAEIFDQVDSLPTFWTKHFYHGTGDHVRAADCMTSFLGWVVLASPDQAAIDRDHAAIRELEGQVQIDPAS